MSDRKPDWQKPVPGNYIGIPYAVFDLPVYRTLEFREMAVLNAIVRYFNGTNNGRIGVSMEEIAETIGSPNHAANRIAIGILEARGLLVTEKVYPRGARMSNEYRLTFVETGDRHNRRPPTREYLEWRPEYETRKKRPQPQPRGKISRSVTEGRTASRVSTIEREGKLSVSAIETHSPDLRRSRVSTVEGLLVYQERSEAAQLPEIGKKAGGDSATAEDDRPDAIPPDRWLAAKRVAEENPAGPEAAELRQRVAEHIDQYGRGSQGRLAKAAGILEGTFSKFRSGELDLPNRLRVQLACAIPRAATIEEREQPRRALNGRR